jgi:hypothetical protein
MTEAMVDALFRWHKVIELGGRQIHMRTLSALDDNERTRQAMFAARKVRSELLSDDSDLRASLRGLGREAYLNIAKVWEQQAAAAAASYEKFAELHPASDPPEPVEPTLEAALDAEDAWAREMQAVADRRADWTKRKVAQEMEAWAAKSDDDLFEGVVEREIEGMARQAYMAEFEAQTIHRACYSDQEFTRSTFRSAAEAASVDRYVFRKLMTEYYELDRFAQDSDSLKN